MLSLNMAANPIGAMYFHNCDTNDGSQEHHTWRSNDAADAGDMLQGKLEQDQLHGLLADSIVI